MDTSTKETSVTGLDQEPMQDNAIESELHSSSGASEKKTTSGSTTSMIASTCLSMSRNIQSSAKRVPDHIIGNWRLQDHRNGNSAVK